MKRPLGVVAMSLAFSACRGGDGRLPEPYRSIAVPEERLRSAEARERGRALFLEHCALCHGERADGRGVRQQASEHSAARLHRPGLARADFAAPRVLTSFARARPAPRCPRGRRSTTGRLGPDGVPARRRSNGHERDRVGASRCAGIVQGVGFRPWVYRLAREEGVGGRVSNGAEASRSRRSVSTRRSTLPRPAALEPLLRPRASASSSGHPIPAEPAKDFVIVESRGEGEPPGLDPAGPRDLRRIACAEIFDPSDRRYRYPFTNCTNCGPRFTIARGVPVRPAGDDDGVLSDVRGLPARVRLAARPPFPRAAERLPGLRPASASPSTPTGGDSTRRPDRGRRGVLRAGGIVADQGRRRLSPRLRRDLAGGGRAPARPQAARREALRRDGPATSTAADGIAVLDEHGAGAPVLRRAADRARPSAAAELGRGARGRARQSPRRPPAALLAAPPSAPRRRGPAARHDLRQPLGRADRVRDDGRPSSASAGIADLFLLHDRDIESRCDDSVARVIAGRSGRLPALPRLRPAVLPVRRPFERPVLACGGHLKNTFCIGVGDTAYLGPHIGDLDGLETVRAFEEAIERAERFLGVRPEIVAHDLHPLYVSTRYALGTAGAAADRGPAPPRPRRRAPWPSTGSRARSSASPTTARDTGRRHGLGRRDPARDRRPVRARRDAPPDSRCPAPTGRSARSGGSRSRCSSDAFDGDPPLRRVRPLLAGSGAPPRARAPDGPARGIQAPPAHGVGRYFDALGLSLPRRGPSRATRARSPSSGISPADPDERGAVSLRARRASEGVRTPGPAAPRAGRDGRLPRRGAALARSRAGSTTPSPERRRRWSGRRPRRPARFRSC